MTGVVLTFFFSVLRAPDFNYDLVNLRGQLAWSITRGRLGIDSFEGSRYLFPPLNDAWNILLLGTGSTWVPVAFWSAVHALIPIVVYLIIKGIAPEWGSWATQLLALTSLSSPLLLMQIGTSFGHLTSSVFISLALLFLLRCRQVTNPQLATLAGAMLGVAVLIRMSNLPSVPAYLLGVTFLVATTTDFARFALGFGTVFGGSYFAWSWYASNEVGTRFQGFSVVPLGLPGSVALIAAIFASVYLTSTDRLLLSKRIQALLNRLPLGVLRIFLATSICAVVFQVRTAADPRFLVTSWSQVPKRLIHTGGLERGCCPVDLEIPYWDLRMPLMYFALALVLLFSLTFRRRFSPVSIGVVIFCCLPVLAYLAFSGYARYASQALVVAPVALTAIIQEVTLKAQLKKGLIFLGVLLLSFPAIHSMTRGSAIPRFAQLAESEKFFTREELAVVNDLLPEDAKVYIAGDLVSLVAQQLNRPDLIWTWKMPLASEALSSRNLLVLYNPMTPLPLAELETRGLFVAECNTLRFTNSSLGLCRLVLNMTSLMQARAI